MKLQVNTAGAWKDVVTFDALRTNDVVAALEPLAIVLGPEVKWCLVSDDNSKRNWLPHPAGASLAQVFSAEPAK